MPRLQLSCLPSVQVVVDERQVTAFRSVNERALLVYLAVEHERPHQRETLAGLLWPDASETVARRNLNQTLLNLRTALGDRDAARPLLLATRQTVQLNTADIWVDVTAIAAHLAAAVAQPQADAAGRAACMEQLREAVGHYHGAFLREFARVGSDLFGEWALLKREWLERKIIVALGQLADYHLECGDTALAERYARHQLDLDILDEGAHRRLMRGLALAGDRSAALAQYATCCQVLEAELGVEPDEETHRLYEQIRTGASVEFKVLNAELSPTSPHTQHSKLSTQNSEQQDWSEAPEPGRFYGRQAEAAQLSSWLIEEHCQLVIVLGIGGVGKTTLSATVAHAVAERFDRLIWRSLLNAPPLDELLRPLLQSLTGQALAKLPATLDDQLALLLDYLRKQRCLLVLDNLESLLQADGLGQMRAGYEGYAHLLHRLAHSKHQSCLLLTSREMPQGIARWEADLEWVRALRLEGLDRAASQSLLKARGLTGQEADAHSLIGRYSGHPLALKLMAETVHELFGGAIGDFLREDTLIFDDIRALLDQQFARLSPLEQEILFWLAIEREPVPAATLRNNLVQKPGSGHLLEALRALQRRSLLEQHSAGFTLQNVVIEYLTARLTNGVCAELLQADKQNFTRQLSWSPSFLLSVSLLNRFALLKAQAKEYVRQSQARLILQPIADRLVANLGRAGVGPHIQAILSALRTTAPRVPGYAGGNLLNLLLHLRIDISGYDFSRLSVWQADLRGRALAALNFAEADLADSAFTFDFGTFAIKFDKSGHMLLAAPFKSGGISFWRIANGQIYDGFRTPGAGAYPMVFSPDGRFLAGCCPDHSVRLWSVETGAELHILRGHTALAHTVAFSDDSQYLASNSPDNTIRLWDVHSGQSVQILSYEHPNYSPLALRSATKGQRPASAPLLASVGSGHTICLWDTHSGQVVDVLHEHTREVEGLAFSPDGTVLASAGHDGAILIWDVRIPGRAQLLSTLHGHSQVARALVFHPDSQLLASGSDDGTARLWDVRSGQAQQILIGHVDEVAHLAFHPDGHALASCSVDYVVKLWDVQTGRALDSLNGAIYAIHAVCFRPDGRQLASAGADRHIRLWDSDSGRLVRSFQGHAGQVLTVAFSPDGRLLASGSTDTRIQVWDVATGKALFTLHGHTGAVKSLVFSPDGRLLASGSADRTIRLWSVTYQSALAISQHGRVLYGHIDEVATVAFHPDGHMLISSSYDHTARLWSVDSGQEIYASNVHTAALAAAAFNLAGDRVASIGYDNMVHVWEVATGRSSAGWTGISAIGRVVAFSPHGNLLAHGTEESGLAIRDVRTGELMHSLHGHTSTIIGLDFSPTEAILASSAWDGTIRLWDLETSACLRTLRAPGPYAGMNIAGVTGIGPAQKTTLVALGAIEEEPLYSHLQH